MNTSLARQNTDWGCLTIIARLLNAALFDKVVLFNRLPSMGMNIRELFWLVMGGWNLGFSTQDYQVSHSRFIALCGNPNTQPLHSLAGYINYHATFTANSSQKLWDTLTNTDLHITRQEIRGYSPTSSHQWIEAKIHPTSAGQLEETPISCIAAS